MTTGWDGIFAIPMHFPDVGKGAHLGVDRNNDSPMACVRAGEHFPEIPTNRLSRPPMS